MEADFCCNDELVFEIVSKSNASTAELQIDEVSGQTTLKFFGFAEKKNLEVLIIRNFDVSEVDELSKVNGLLLVNRSLDKIDEYFVGKNISNIKYLSVYSEKDQHNMDVSNYNDEADFIFIESFPNIEKFLVVGHNFSTIGNRFETNKKIKELIIPRNSIKYLASDTFSNLRQLQHLDLQNNLLEKLPSNIFAQNIKLEYLDLSHNEISELPKYCFWKTNQVKHLEINGNKIEKLSSKLFLKTKNLKEINMQFNKIEIMPERLFKNNLKLEKVNFGFNKIKFISKKHFEGLAELQEVDFQSNQIKSLDSVFSTNIKLTDVNFEWNEISKISPDIFHKNGTSSEYDGSNYDFGNNPCTNNGKYSITSFNISKCTENWKKTISVIEKGRRDQT